MTLDEWREAWAVLQNRRLARHGFDIRVDHRSFEEQRIDLAPTTKIGVGTKHIAREAEKSEREAELDRLRIFEEQRRESARRARAQRLCRTRSGEARASLCR